MREQRYQAGAGRGASRRRAPRSGNLFFEKLAKRAPPHYHHPRKERKEKNLHAGGLVTDPRSLPVPLVAAACASLVMARLPLAAVSFLAVVRAQPYSACDDASAENYGTNMMEAFQKDCVYAPTAVCYDDTASNYVESSDQRPIALLLPVHSCRPDCSHPITGLGG